MLRRHAIGGLGVLLITVCLTSTASSRIAGPAAVASSPPTRTGFSYSPLDAQSAGMDSNTGLATLLRALHPDLVRLPVYWSHVATGPGAFNFAEVDGLLSVVAGHNAAKRATLPRLC